MTYTTYILNCKILYKRFKVQRTGVNNMKIPIIKLDKDLPTPHYKHDGDAGMDLYSSEDVIILPGEFKLVGTGLKMAIPYGFEAQIRPRSGLAAKHGVSIVNTPGTVDGGYRGEFMVILINHGKEPFEIKRADRIAQMIVNKFEAVHLEEVEVLPDSSRAEGGLGSTGKRD